MTELSARWRAAVLLYARRVNRYVEQGERSGWKQVVAEPKVPDLADLLDPWLEALRRANAMNSADAVSALREAWPICYEPLVPLLEGNAQGIAPLMALNEREWLLRVGDPWTAGRCFHLGPGFAHARPDFEHFGASPDGRYVALLEGDRINAYEGWQGPRVSSFDRPVGDEAPPAGVRIAATREGAYESLYQLTPYQEGQRLLVVLNSGVLVLSAQGVTRLVPEAPELQESWSQLGDSERSDGMVPFAAMVHACVSPDEQFIVAGIQDGRHRVFDADSLERVGQVGPHSEYPHHAGFSGDGKLAYFNACHFYGGATIAVPLADLVGLETDYYQTHPSIQMLQQGARVYASTSRADEIILGDAYGYLHGVSNTGELRWKHYIGGTISAMAVSRDERQLMVATHAGWAALLELDSPEPAPERIGTSQHKEICRWIFWMKESQEPLLW
jgi:hypothetical protein